MASKKALGRGLNALFQAQVSEKIIPTPLTKSDERHGMHVENMPVDQIKPNRHQPRRRFNEDALNELAASIKLHGLAQPLIVSETAEAGQYELVVGERRLRAAKMAGLPAVPCIIKKFSNQKKYELALIENIQREDLNIMEEALAIDGLMKEYGLTQEKVAEALAKSRSAIANTLRYLRLHEDVQSALQDNMISEGHAKCLAGLQAHSEQLRFLTKILGDQLTVRELEDDIKRATARRSGTPKKSTKSVSPETQKIEEDLQRLLGRRVEIQSKGKKGWIRFAFYTPWDLETLLKRLTLLDQNNEIPDV